MKIPAAVASVPRSARRLNLRWDPNLEHCPRRVHLAKHSKHFSLEDSLAIGVDRMQRNLSCHNLNRGSRWNHPRTMCIVHMLDLFSDHGQADNGVRGPGVSAAF